METLSSASKIVPKSGNEELFAMSQICRAEQEQIFDISNDSPIVGLTLGAPGPRFKSLSSSKCEKRPEFGEALLRHQVNSLLQKIEEEPENPVGITLRCSEGVSVSSAWLSAPTPSNFPNHSMEIFGSDDVVELGFASSISTSNLIQASRNQEVVSNDGSNEEMGKHHENAVIRRLLFDNLD